MTAWTTWQRAAALALLFALTVTGYRGVFANGFVYDDAVTVVKNPAVRSLTRAPDWVLSPYAVSANRGGKNYRPTVVASYGLDYAVWKGRAIGFHATNLLIHLAVVGCVFVLARRLWRADLPALVSAAWMALHPINSQAVNYITARSSTLAALGVAAAVWCYDRWAGGKAPIGGLQGDAEGQTGRTADGSSGAATRIERNTSPSATDARSLPWLVGAMACGVVAFGAKEAAAVLPLLILAWDRARYGASSGWRGSLVRSLPFWGLLGTWLAVRQLVVGGPPGPSDAPWGWMIQGLGFGAKIVNTAALQSLWPAGLAVDYGWPLALDFWALMGTMAGTAALAGAVWALSRLDPRLAWCGVWFVVSLLPVLALPFITRIALYQEHRAYLAEIGVAWIAGGLVWFARSRGGAGGWVRGVAAGAAIAAVIAAIWVDGERTLVWRDAVVLWEDALAKYPDSAVARGERGTWLLNNGRIREAEQEFLTALRTMPNYVYTYLMLGMTYAKQGETERAISAYRTALEFRPSFVEARIRLGLAYEQLGLADQALAEYDRAIQDDPWASPALVFSAIILEARGRRDEALERLRRVAPDDPIYPDARAVLDRLGGDQRISWTGAAGAMS